MSYIETVKKWLYDLLKKENRPLKLKELCLRARSDRETNQKEYYDLTGERIVIAADELIREYKVRSVIIDNDEWALELRK